MNRRTHESPMDFEYQNGTGPLDARSPFAQISMNAQQHHHHQQQQQQQYQQQGRGTTNNDKKRPFSVFGSSSPTKSTPSLRQPVSHPHFFSNVPVTTNGTNNNNNNNPNSPAKPLPSIPLSARNNPLFSTPRHLDTDDFASSGGETPKSPSRAPGVLDDSDLAATPEMAGAGAGAGTSFRARFAALDSNQRPVFGAGGATGAATQQHDKKPDLGPNRRQSWWRGMTARMTGSSPVSVAASSPDREREREREKERERERRRRERERERERERAARDRGRDDKDTYAHGAERKIRKRRDREQQRAVVQRTHHDRDVVTISDDDDEDDISDDDDAVGGAVLSASPSKRPSRYAVVPREQLQQQQQHHDSHREAGGLRHAAYSVFDFITAHPTLPHILSFYMQLVLNMFLISGVMYILYSFWATIRSDVDKRSADAAAELLAEMAVCAQQYTDNRCARETRVPAMEVVCANWERCMQQDPRNVGRARVSAHTFAEIFNGFIEPISYKAMIFTLLAVFGSIAFSNFAFSIFRDKAAAHAAAHQQHHHYYGGGGAPNAGGLPPPPTPGNRVFSSGNAIEGPYQVGQQMGLEPAQSHYSEIDGRESPVRRLQFR